MKYLQVNEAKLERFAGPFFPANILALNEAYSRLGNTLSFLEASAQMVGDYASIIPEVVTSDGYMWRAELHIIRPGFEFAAVLLPQKSRATRQLERSIAFYRNILIGHQTSLESLCSSLTDAMEKLAFEQVYVGS